MTFLDAAAMPRITGSYSAFSYPPKAVISTSSIPSLRPMPVNAHEGQNSAEFDNGLRLYEAEPIGTHALFPQTALCHFVIENAYFVIYPGLDGLLINDHGQLIAEPSCFCRHDLYNGSDGILPEMPMRNTEMEEVFVGVDAAWDNYFHWITFGISRMQVANSLLPSNVEIVVPDIEMPYPRRHQAYPNETYYKSLSLAGLSDRVKPLANGVYRARKLHFFWNKPAMPDLYLDTALPHQLFDSVEVGARPELPKRFYFTHLGIGDEHINPSEQAAIDAVLRKRDIAKVFLGNLDFATQVALFRQAEFVIAPHGPALANMVFAKPGTRLLELNRRLDPNHLRNCYYIVTLQRRQPYAVLDLDAGDLTTDLLEEAIERLDKAGS